MKNAGAMPLHDLTLGVFVDVSLSLIWGETVTLYKLFCNLFICGIRF